MRIPKLSAGDLNRRFILQYSDAPLDGGDRNWQDVRKVSVSVKPLTAYDQEEARREEYQARVLVRCRYIDGISAGSWRFVHRVSKGSDPAGKPLGEVETAYVIMGIEDPGLAHRELWVYCRTLDATT